MFDLLRIAMIGKATAELLEEAEPLFDLPQQQAAAIGSDPPAVEAGRDFTAAQGLKINAGLLHSVSIGLPPCVWRKLLVQKQLMPYEAALFQSAL